MLSRVTCAVTANSWSWTRGAPSTPAAVINDVSRRATRSSARGSGLVRTMTRSSGCVPCASSRVSARSLAAGATGAPERLKTATSTARTVIRLRTFLTLSDTRHCRRRRVAAGSRLDRPAGEHVRCRVTAAPRQRGVSLVTSTTCGSHRQDCQGRRGVPGACHNGTGSSWPEGQKRAHRRAYTRRDAALLVSVPPRHTRPRIETPNPFAASCALHGPVPASTQSGTGPWTRTRSARCSLASTSPSGASSRSAPW